MDQCVVGCVEDRSEPRHFIHRLELALFQPVEQLVEVSGGLVQHAYPAPQPQPFQDDGGDEATQDQAHSERGFTATGREKASKPAEPAGCHHGEPACRGTWETRHRDHRPPAVGAVTDAATLHRSETTWIIGSSSRVRSCGGLGRRTSSSPPDQATFFVGSRRRPRCEGPHGR